MEYRVQLTYKEPYAVKEMDCSLERVKGIVKLARSFDDLKIDIKLFEVTLKQVDLDKVVGEG